MMIGEAYRMTLRLRAYRHMCDNDRWTPPNRVRGTRETEASDQVQKQLESFLSAQQRWQQELEEMIARRLDGSPNLEVKDQYVHMTGRPIVCYD